MSPSLSQWGENGPRPEVNHELDDLFARMTFGSDVRVACTPQEAWALVSDVVRVGEFSPECAEAWWMDPGASDKAGARFEGKNRIEGPQGTHEWVRLCVITAWDPYKRVSWTVGDRFDGTPATEWTYSIDPAGGSDVVIREEFRHLPDGLSGLREAAQKAPETTPELVAKRSAKLAQGIVSTLDGIRTALEKDSAANA